MDFLLNNFGRIILSAIGALLLFICIKKYSRIKTFVTEVRVELSKVSWPSKNELVGSTTVVFVITAILAVFIGIIDLALSNILGFLFK